MKKSYDKTHKIALVGDALFGGGAEKVHAFLSQYFTSENIEVHNIIFYNQLGYEYGGELYNLGLLPDRTKLDKFNKIIALRKYLKKHQIDLVVDFRYRVNFINELLIRNLAYNSQVIYTIRSGILEYYIPKNKLVANLIYKKNRIISVSQFIEKKVKAEYNFNVSTIYNPIDSTEFSIQSVKKSFQETEYILAVGRMNYPIKQFDHLITAYANSILPKKNIKLIILGEGILRKKYQEMVDQLHLNNQIIFKGNVENPFPYYKNAKFTVLTSKNEGFPNVLIESLALQTPVVSYDCVSGPNEIILHKSNGLLVENQNINAFTDAINLLVNDSELYLKCKKNAYDSVKKYEIEMIGKQWLDTLRINL